MNLIRKCKTCNVDIWYNNRCSFRYAIRNNNDCKRYSALKRQPKSDKTRKKISETLTGKTIPQNVVEKIRNTLKEKFNTSEYKEKFSVLHKGENNPMYGKIHTEESRKKMSENTKLSMQQKDVKEKFYKSHKSKQYREKLSKLMIGRKHSEESKRKMREAIVRRVKKYGIHSRSFNPKACEIMDEYGKKNGYNFQHALNGGEYSCAGYMVDGYDKEKNIVIEIDEKQHFDFNGNLKQKDIKRQKEIEKELGCKFIRIPFIKT